MTHITIQNLGEFTKALEKEKIKYIVIAGWGLDGKRGKQTRVHQDLDILCLKKDFRKVKKIISNLGYVIKENFNNLYKLFREDGAKVDLAFLMLKGDYLLSNGRIAITKFPKVLFEKSQIGNVEGVKFKIAPNELLKTWGSHSQKGNDAEFAKKLKVNKGLVEMISRKLKGDMIKN